MKNKKSEEARAAKALREAANREAEDKVMHVGDTVKMKGTRTQGTIEELDGKTAIVIFGGMRTKLPADRLEKVVATQGRADGSAETEGTKMDALREGLQGYKMSRMTQETMDDHRKNFKQDIDVRGMRGDEALQAVQYFIDDAILVGMNRVRILHGKGNGILRQLIRQYLASEPAVTHFADEHVQFGGAGITVVDLA
jgi:DNA mismatch repair protein MutS2